MYFHQYDSVHQFSPIKTIPTIPLGLNAKINPSTVTQFYQAESQIYTQPLKQSTLSSFKPYTPDPEVEKIISKYNTTQKKSQIEQPITQWQSNNIEQNSQKLFRDTQQNKNEEFEFKDNSTPMHFQFDEIKQRKLYIEQKNYSPDLNEFENLSSSQQQKQVALPEQNDKIVNLVVSGIIILLVVYIISMLVLK